MSDEPNDLAQIRQWLGWLVLLTAVVVVLLAVIAFGGVTIKS